MTTMAFWPFCVLTVLGAASVALGQAGGVLRSPDGRLAVEFKMSEGGSPAYNVKLGELVVLRDSRLGLVREDADFSRGLTLTGQSAVEPVEDRYELATAKHRVNVYRANRQVYHLVGPAGKMDVIFQVSNDGLAFRYVFPETSEQVRKLREEVTSFRLPLRSRGWLQPMSTPKTGFAQTNPSYEENYAKGVEAGRPSPNAMGWVYPALFQVAGADGAPGDNWVVISETGVGRTYCGTRLRAQSPDAEYSVGFADPREVMNNGPANPESRLPWATPWRLVAVGNLKTVMESTLGTDLADKPTVQVPAGTVKPGRSSWSWPILGDGRTNYETQKQFIDYAAEMKWEYCLIDALWDVQIGYERVKELADYAATKNVGVLVWYNSAGNWNTAPQTPRDKMLTHESRVAEFKRIKEMGIKGVKIDFFGGDGQSVMAYYHDILEDSAPFGLLVNFHGCTLPRGWQRTYPHLMTMESVKGFEYITFGQANANEEPQMATIVPFARNLFDPMDFTPMALWRVNARIQRRTTSGFQLALPVVFHSGIQHFPEIPEGMARMPEYVREFVRQVPAHWEETRFVEGFPGRDVVLARRSAAGGTGGGKWFVGGINGEATEKKLTLNLAGIGKASRATLITDGATELFEQREVSLPADRKLEVTVKPTGGFVLVVE